MSFCRGEKRIGPASILILSLYTISRVVFCDTTGNCCRLVSADTRNRGGCERKEAAADAGTKGERENGVEARKKGEEMRQRT